MFNWQLFKVGGAILVAFVGLTKKDDSWRFLTTPFILMIETDQDVGDVVAVVVVLIIISFLLFCFINMRGRDREREREREIEKVARHGGYSVN